MTDTLIDLELAILDFDLKRSPGHRAFKHGDEPTESSAVRLEGLKSVKHGDHDQSTHGSWSDGGRDYQPVDDPQAFGNALHGEYIANLSLGDQTLLSQYASVGATMNEALRRGREWVDEESGEEIATPHAIQESFESNRDDINEIIAKAPPLEENIKAYRIVTTGFVDNFIVDNELSGYHDKGFTSTTLDREWAESTAKALSEPDDGGFWPEAIYDVIEVDIPAGTKALFLTDAVTPFENQDELLLPAGTSFQIEDRDEPRVRVR